MPTHETLSGHVINYERPLPKVEAFLAKLREMLGDARTTEQEMTGFAYGRDNPILDHTLFPGRGAVTKEVLDDPVYHVITDLLARKNVAERGADIEKIARGYTMTVAEAAAQLGITEQAVRKAIASRRLPSWVKDGQHFLHPKTVAAFEIAPRGFKRETEGSEAERARARRADHTLAICIGHTEGKKLSIRAPTELTLERVEGNVQQGEVPNGWQTVGVLSGGDGKDRFWLLEPASSPNEIVWGPFFVRGRFRVAEKVNNAEKARATWKDFKAS